MKVTKEEILASDWPMSLDPEFDGSCPCCTITGEGFVIETKCWRVWSENGSGIVVAGMPEQDALKVAAHIRDHNGWTGHTNWQIVVSP